MVTDIWTCIVENCRVQFSWKLAMHYFTNILNKQQNFAQEITIFLERKVK